jgi:hypothetical protein
MLDGVLASGLIHGLPLLADVRIHWQYFPQPLGIPTAFLLAAACLACDWRGWQRRSERTFFERPDWQRVFRFRITLADLFEFFCLLAVIFMLSRFYWTTEPRLDATRSHNYRADACLSPRTFLTAGIIICGLVFWRNWQIWVNNGRTMRMVAFAACIVICRLIHPLGALFAPLAIGALIYFGRRHNALLSVIVVTHLLFVFLAFVSAGVQRDHPGASLLPHDLLILIAYPRGSELIAALLMTPFPGPRPRWTRLYALCVAMLANQAIAFSHDIIDYYSHPPSPIRDYHLGVRELPPSR